MVGPYITSDNCLGRFCSNNILRCNPISEVKTTSVDSSDTDNWILVTNYPLAVDVRGVGEGCDVESPGISSYFKCEAIFKKHLNLNPIPAGLYERP